METGLLAVGAVAVVVRSSMLTLQPAMTDSWLPLMVTSLFIIYVYLPIRLPAAAAFAAFYSAVAVSWWVLLYGAPHGVEQVYFGILWVMLVNGLGFAAANALQRSQRTQFAQSLLLHKLLSTDSLTGIANRRRFDEPWRANGGAAAASACRVAVDDRCRSFKAYNDHYGHQQGDECLRQVARLLPTAGRPGDLVARYGGEEFLFLLPDAGMPGRPGRRQARRDGAPGGYPSPALAGGRAADHQHRRRHRHVSVGRAGGAGRRWPISCFMPPRPPAAIRSRSASSARARPKPYAA